MFVAYCESMAFTLSGMAFVREQEPSRTSKPGIREMVEHCTVARGSGHDNRSLFNCATCCWQEFEAFTDTPIIWLSPTLPPPSLLTLMHSKEAKLVVVGAGVVVGAEVEEGAKLPVGCCEVGDSVVGEVVDGANVGC